MMEIFTLVALFVTIFTITTLYNTIRRSNWVHKNKGNTLKGSIIPQPQGAWPIIGHLPLLTGKTKPHRALAAISDQLGPVFAVRLGSKPTVIISSSEAAKECFTTNDHALATRPKFSLGKHMGHDYAVIALAPYGSYWRHMRKISVVELLSISKVDNFVPLRTYEIGEFIKGLYNQSTICNSMVINIDDWFRHLTVNIIMMMVASKRSTYTGGGEEDNEVQLVVGVIKECMHAAGSVVISDFVPIRMLKWLELKGNILKMKDASRKLDSIVDNWVDEHRQRRINHAQIEDDDHDHDHHGDFIDALLSQVGEGELKFDDQFTTQTIITATVETMLVGATDGTSIVLIWTLSLLINHPQFIKKSQVELDGIVGSNRWVEESDIKKLTHLQAIVKEALRLYPPGPLSVPHEASQDCLISGYPVQKGTLLIVNIWKLQRDPRVWSDPDEFNPERFLSGLLANANIGSGNHFEVMPFGSGRRQCPGSETALRIIQLTIARLLQGFNMSTLDNKSVDMSEGPGITTSKFVPLQLLLTPRLPHVMYHY